MQTYSVGEGSGEGSGEGLTTSRKLISSETGFFEIGERARGRDMRKSKRERHVKGQQEGDVCRQLGRAHR